MPDLLALNSKGPRQIPSPLLLLNDASRRVLVDPGIYLRTVENRGNSQS